MHLFGSANQGSTYADSPGQVNLSLDKVMFFYSRISLAFSCNLLAEYNLEFSFEVNIYLRLYCHNWGKVRFNPKSNNILFRIHQILHRGILILYGMYIRYIDIIKKRVITKHFSITNQYICKLSAWIKELQLGFTIGQYIYTCFIWLYYRYARLCLQVVAVQIYVECHAVC